MSSTCSSTTPRSPREASVFSNETRTVEPAFASLTALFKTIEAGFTRGLWRLDDGTLDTDVDEFYTLAAELNPGATYWQ